MGRKKKKERGKENRKQNDRSKKGIKQTIGHIRLVTTNSHEKKVDDDDDDDEVVFASDKNIDLEGKNGMTKDSLANKNNGRWTQEKQKMTMLTINR